MSNHYTGEQIRLRAAALKLNGSIEDNRWRLAALAAQAEDNNVPGWGEIISMAVRRSPSTVYEWRKAWRLRKSVNPMSRLSISFWVSAANGIKDDNHDEVLDWLAQCEDDDTITLESARAHFPHAEKKDRIETPPLSDAVQTAVSVLVDLTAHPQLPAIVRPFVETAVGALRQAMDALAERETA